MQQWVVSLMFFGSIGLIYGFVFLYSFICFFCDAALNLDSGHLVRQSFLIDQHWIWINTAFGGGINMRPLLVLSRSEVASKCVNKINK